jgi:hypothetical protein
VELNQIDKNNANAIKQLALVGIDVTNRLKETLNQTSYASDHPESWIATARRNFERTLAEALRVERGH